MALVLMRLFLALNGAVFAASPASKYAIMISLAAGEVSEADLTRWVRDHLEQGRQAKSPP